MLSKDGTIGPGHAGAGCFLYPEDYDRARACVNACAGIPSYLLRDVRPGFFATAIRHLADEADLHKSIIRADEIIAQRERLAAALRSIVTSAAGQEEEADEMGWTAVDVRRQCIAEARAALAELEGGAS